jgi:tRNA pseudouridine38-40 synthase
MTLWRYVARLPPLSSSRRFVPQSFVFANHSYSSILNRQFSIAGMSELVEKAVATAPAVTATKEQNGNADAASEPVSATDATGTTDEATAGATTTSNKDEKQKRKNKNPYGNLKKKRRDNAANLDPARGTWRKTEINEKNTTPHEGSFASPAMQEKFKITLPDDPPEDAERQAKRKMALLISYIGSNYAGFQINKDQRTLQAELEFAIFKAGMLQKTNFGFPHKYGWSTSGRTDKGVHACAQVCSLKLEIGDASEDEVRERINAHLPDDIQVLDLKRTTRNFCAKTNRCKVRYQYMIPSYIFFADAKQLFADAGIDPEERKKNDPLTPEEIQSLRLKVKDYRVTTAKMDLLKSALALYAGTNTYHNFTRGMMPGDKTAQRYIIEFSAHDPIIRSDGTEWIPTQVLGQSFLLNQIRKMIAVACDVVCERATLDTMKRALEKETKVILPIAPPHGLFLDMSVYDQYNVRTKRTSDTAFALDWINEPESPAMQRWREFKDKKLLTTIVEEEAEEGNFIKFLYQQTNVFESEDNYHGNGKEPTST